MLSGKRLIARYVIGAALPYVLLSGALLTAILLAQQSTRFAELALYTQLPIALLGEIESSLVPNVLVFTLPMAVLAGVIVGYARMGSDSEIVAMRAAGIGTWSMLWPALLIGLIAAAAASYINMNEAPQAARGLRRAALRGALRKLDSPVDPRTFTTEIPNYVIYVRDGNKVEGEWGRVFIYAQEPGKPTRIVTARSGRIDSSGDKSELVLKDSVGITLPAADSPQPNQYEVSRSDQFRFSIDTGRGALLKRLDRSEREPDEMSLADLRAQAKSSNPGERKEAERMLHKRLAFSFSPLLFALLGASIGLRVRRGGKGIGVLLAIAIMIGYYLLFLLGESLSRVGTLTPIFGAWLATAFMLLLSITLLTVNRRPLARLFMRDWKAASVNEGPAGNSRRRLTFMRVRHWGFPSLMDANLLRTLLTSFVVGLCSLVAIFIIFTLFELWRFIAMNGASARLVTKYLLYLLPLITVEVFPATMLIAVLVTYALLSRRSEAIAWWACGQSVYRLMLPGLIFAIAVAAGAWVVQEKLMPGANIRQDALRQQIRGGAVRATTGTGHQWLASAESNRLYSYEYDEQHHVLRDPTLYDFDQSGVHLEKVTSGEQGKWIDNTTLTITNAETIAIRGLELEHQKKSELEMTKTDSSETFKPGLDKPSQLSSSSLSIYLKSAKRRGIEVSALAVALQRKYAEPFSILVMAFLGIPLALSFGRRGAVIALCSAVAVSLAYWGIEGGFQQLGNHGLLPASVAGWAPPIIFAAGGVYFLARIRT